MSSELVINVTSQETRVALLENETLAELYVEWASDRSIVGNIYKGRVSKVLPGMQASFVDIGLPRSGFLYVDDIQDNTREYSLLFGLEEEVDCEAPSAHVPSWDIPRSIEDKIVDGQELLVQVAKDPIGSKGARLTTNISLPGRYVVVLPHMSHVGVSRRIEDEAERQRLRDMLGSMRPEGFGVIARTASEGAKEEELRAEVGFLVQLWEVIQSNAERSSAPRLIYSDLDMTLRAVRDLMVEGVDRVVIDSPVEYQKILGFLDAYMADYKDRVHLYKGKEPIFDAYHIETEIARAMERKIWLKSGGYILIEETDALTSIDVNSGRYVGRYNQEETILKINLEAAKEIAYQLRLRNIGGIIIIDFIDMERETSREQVFHALKDALKKDRSRSNILKISDLGLVEMTRKRVKEGIGRQLSDPCPYCDGRGRIRSLRMLSYQVLREIQRQAAHTADLTGDVLVEVHPDVAHTLLEEERTGLERLEKEIGRTIHIRPNASFHREQMDVWIG